MTYLNKTKIFTSLFIFLILFTGTVNAQWEIPADAKNKQAPNEATHSLVKAGKDIYNAKCASCHGNPGEGNNIAAINATDLGIAEYQVKYAAGEVLWQVDEGKGGMPSFKDKFSDDEKWNLIFYIEIPAENIHSNKNCCTTCYKSS